MDYFRSGKNRVPVTIEYQDDEILLNFGYNEVIKNEVKIMEGARWNPDRKCWKVKRNQRNQFAIDYLLGSPVYNPWDCEGSNFKPNRGLKAEDGVLYAYQASMAGFMVSRPGSIIAAEMGTGKSLCSIEVVEYFQEIWGDFAAWYVAPKVALLSATRDYAKWKAKKRPHFFTIHEFVQQVKALSPQSIPPRVLILDEASKFKNPAAKSTQAAQWLADFMREHWKGEERVILMSGSPAPKSPLDWWSLCNIARPGFLKEGTPTKFLDRLAVVKKMVGESGVSYPKIITFKDDIRKCSVCGRFDNHELHTLTPLQAMMCGKELDQHPHAFIPVVNEVENLHNRMQGLVTVVLKKDVLELPEKVYQVIKLPPSKYMKSLAKMVVKTAGTAANALILLRELSDGFQYHSKLDGAKDCENCQATGVMILDGESRECIHCAGKKQIKQYTTETLEVETPKVQATLDLLELKEDDGRIIIYGAFQGTIDRICQTVVKGGWHFVRRDGRGWHSDLGTSDPNLLLDYFQRDKPCEHDRIAFVAHPASAGMGLTLTASDTTLYYSNSFNGEDRTQSEDRNHRHGCRGANIFDFEHLPVDKLVRENIFKKRKLELVTLGEIVESMENDDES